MIDGRPRGADEPSDSRVDFYAAGEPAKGEFRCSDCGYGVAVATALPNCPMCGGGAWERGPWTPFARADARRRSSPAQGSTPA